MLRLLPFGATAVAVGLLVWTGDPGAESSTFVLITLVWGVLVGALLRRGLPPLQVAILAILVRAPLLTLSPTLSDDVWRYVWEGEVWRAGFNPFRSAPNNPELTTLRDAVWERVNHREVPSIYPPAAQLLFVVLADGGVWAWRVASATADIGTAYLLERARPRAGLLWALLPLPALESAVSGHLEGIGVLFFVAAITTRRGIWAWCGAMIKLLPGVLLVLQPRRTWLFWAALTVGVMLPVVELDGFETYRAHWSFNGSIFPILDALTNGRGRGTSQVLSGLIVAGILLSSREPSRVALWVSGTFVLFSPTVHPWYVLWPLAAALLNGSSAWTVLAVLTPVSYLVLGTRDPHTGAWTESIAVRWVEYAPFYAALAWEAWARATRPGPASTS